MQSKPQLPRIYIWEKYDDIVQISIKLSGDAHHWPLLLDANKGLMHNNEFRMSPGDVLTLPERFPVDGKKYAPLPVVRTDSGTQYILLAKILTDEFDIARFGPFKIPTNFKPRV